VRGLRCTLAVASTLTLVVPYLCPNVDHHSFLKTLESFLTILWIGRTQMSPGSGYPIRRSPWSPGKRAGRVSLCWKGTKTEAQTLITFRYLFCYFCALEAVCSALQSPTP
jgi:hypothetical protein